MTGKGISIIGLVGVLVLGEVALANQQSPFDWVPNGGQNGPINPACLPSTLEGQLLALPAPVTAKGYSDVLNVFFSKCGELLYRVNKSTIVLGGFATVQYPWTENHKLKPWNVTLQDGSKMMGYIGIQDQEKRPWILFKCGLFCTADTDSYSVRNFLISLFDQSPFNVVVMGNRTGFDYIKENRRLTDGGYYEATDFYEVADWLRHSEYASTVDSVHVMGVSLAGSAALYSAAYNPELDHSVRFDSISAICPVVNLKPSIDNLLIDNDKGRIFKRSSWKKLLAAKPYLDRAQDLLTRDTEPSFVEMQGLFGEIPVRYKEQQNPLSFSMPLKIVKNADDFWFNNQFGDRATKLETPVFVWASQDDSVVNNALNTQALLDHSHIENRSDMGITNVPYGDHCAFSTAYGFPVTSAVLRSYVLLHSPKYLKAHPQKQFSYPGSALLLSQDEVIVQNTWTYDFEKKIILLNYEIYNKSGFFCRLSDPFAGPASCRRKVTQEFTPEALHLQDTMDFKVPANATEAVAISRKLNGQFDIRVGDQTIIGGRQSPDTLWVTW